MKQEYDLSKLKSRKNPYAAKLNNSVSIRLGDDIIEYFKSMSEEVSIPYEHLISLYLRDCVRHHRKVDISCGVNDSW
jgi:predicted DNA binding CopG/RHH family protein